MPIRWNARPATGSEYHRRTVRCGALRAAALNVDLLTAGTARYALTAGSRLTVDAVRRG